MQPQGTSVFNPAYLSNLTAQINGISNDIHAINPCAAIQAIVNDAMAEVQAEISAIEAQITALNIVIQIPSANLGAIVTWISNFVAPSIKALKNYIQQLVQMVAALNALLAAIEAAANQLASLTQLTACHVAIPLPSLALSVTTDTTSALTLATSPSVSFSGVLGIADSAGTVATNLPALTALNASGNLGTVALSGTTGATSALAITSSLSSHLSGTIGVADSATSVLNNLPGLQTLNTAGTLGSVTITAPTDAATALAISAELATRLSGTIDVTDTAANIFTNLYALESMAASGSLGTVTVTGTTDAATASAITTGLTTYLSGPIATS